ncbi:MAG TPA: hypothetical protein VGP94_14115 [Tepidisphaeraceae bacterium]|jgi:hypothetical protein|nr:hypothetical protein [Tepidisphaeraceae bacterium]
MQVLSVNRVHNRLNVQKSPLVVKNTNSALALEHARRALQANPAHEAARQLRDSLEKRDATSGGKSGG